MSSSKKLHPYMCICIVYCNILCIYVYICKHTDAGWGVGGWVWIPKSSLSTLTLYDN